MKLSSRLLACAELVQKGNVAADIGTDHGHLPIYLLENGICPRVLAADLREKPLDAARRNARLAGITENLEFYLSDGLARVPLEGVDTIICAGMGGDTIIEILRNAAALPDNVQLILQPQADAPRLRGFLGQKGYGIRREVFARDGNFVYTIMEVYPGGGQLLSPGACYWPQGETDRKSPLYRDYMTRVKNGLDQTIQGIRQAKVIDAARLQWFELAQRQLIELEMEQ